MKRFKQIGVLKTEPAMVIAGFTVHGLLAAALTVTALTVGDVHKVETENMRMTLQHGENRSLDMSPMTITF